ncbi:MAG TPA: ABC transporter permease [bacterium]|nr:ABC transporter permease [bacterium]
MLEIRDVHKTYSLGAATVRALQGVSLTIEDGDFVAIMGPSGSGKSTLMHVLGLLDQPDSGSYLVDGVETSRMSDHVLAALRRNTTGFIFQQFHLLPRLTARENVALPALYAKGAYDFERARELLETVGLSDRAEHRPNELSGGQQQRVAIARSLVNAPRILFADEPTGNLDSKSEDEIISILEKLNERGITVIMVTHEDEIGNRAKRVIRMRDGKVQSDERLRPLRTLTATPQTPSMPSKESYQGKLREIWEQARQGFRSLAANKVRSSLSMLGILIGVGAVVAMLALGHGAQKAIEAQLSSLGSNLLVLRPGATHAGGVVLEAGSVTRLTLDDVQALKEKIPAIRDVSPSVSGRGQAAFGDRNWSTQILGVSSSYAQIRASEPQSGRFFTEEENRQRSLVALVGVTVVRELFGEKDPLGETIRINRVALRVIGVLPEKGLAMWRDQDDVVVVPVLTAMYRLLGKDYVDSADIEVADAAEIEATQEEVTSLMIARHRVPPVQQQDAFQVRNLSELKDALTESNRVMSLLLASIAAISLLVGGIGIMNIMLVSVTERTREIGLRKAIGASREDILLQFLVEAVVVSVVGGLLGIASGWIVTLAMSQFAGWTTSVTPDSVALAFLFSAFVGIVFGLYPAKRASELNPIEALRYE